METSKSSKVVDDGGDDDGAEITSLVKTVPILDKLFDLHCKVGEGTFSSVFLATMKSVSKERKFAVKHLVPTCHPGRVERELQCLKEIGGTDHVVGLELCLRYAGSVLFVMPFMRHDKFSEYVQDMDVQETKDYMRALLMAIRRVHKFHIIHRDIKPSNFLYDRGNRRYLLVDFGLAQSYHHESVITPAKPQPIDSSKRKRSDENSQDKSKTTITKTTEHKCYCFGKPRICSLCLTKPQQVAARAGTPGFRAPEVLLKHPSQTPAIDIWACGVIMLCVLSGTQPFFRSPDDMTALAEITAIFGSNRMVQCAQKLGKKIIFSKNIPGIDVVTLCHKLQTRNTSGRNRNSASTSVDILKNCEPKYPSEAYDLLVKLLDVDYNTRITADQALNHPFLK